jgi:PIN domain nuclease of toxin-antitoxin system
LIPVRLLLDTCTFLWIVGGDKALSARAREAFADPDSEVFLSAASAWEIAVKHRLGKLPLPTPPEDFVPTQRVAHGIEPLPVDEEAALHVAKLPDLHRDPFDRMLVAQAIAGGLVLVTPDDPIRQYPVRVLW